MTYEENQALEAFDSDLREVAILHGLDPDLFIGATLSAASDLIPSATCLEQIDLARAIAAGYTDGEDAIAEYKENWERY